MDSFDKAPRFIFNPTMNLDRDADFSGILEIHVHHARNIHNICIYDNQDVYAKFSLTYNPDETLSTRIINGGGKNPEFNEDLIMKINQIDAVLKCEIWMLSRAKNFMDDQLLGFALVPISLVIGKGKVTQDFSLSSTDLFHSPAGTIKLSLSLSANQNAPLNPSVNSLSDSVADSSKTSDLLVDKKIPEEYSRIEFPDINVVNENRQMVSEYFCFAKPGTLLRPWPEKPDGSFLQLGSAPNPLIEDYEMAADSSEEYRADSVSPDGSIQNSGFLSSTMTSLSDDRNSADSMEKKNYTFAETSNCLNGALIMTAEANPRFGSCPETPTSKKSEKKEENEPNLVSAHSRNTDLEAEESAMQQQIVDMYMRSMQQFTESLAKMKLPMALDKPETDNQGDIIQNNDKNIEIDKKKKDNSRVFYGSRAFF
ncbi:Calcium-dependent lipid-binding (CaLB domain) family protein [Forsythia ovata]|uniref:Calcium-dependent lipid-binding (CaLB domain) family protein n=1 Tax=Forsythia ovata TaxID=205694 RepID=A0ABD1T350_9LAMI